MFGFLLQCTVSLIHIVHLKAFDKDWAGAGLVDFCQSPEEAKAIRAVMWTCYPDLARIFENFTANRHAMKSNEVFCMRSSG